MKKDVQRLMGLCGAGPPVTRPARPKTAGGKTTLALVDHRALVFDGCQIAVISF